MTKKNYHTKKLIEARLDKKDCVYTTSCTHCDGYDSYCKNYNPISQIYTSPCNVKIIQVTESKLEMIVK